ncbi:MAG: type I restriction endonuclease subunit M [Ardenticatenales bacterium]|nr:type I restriction endonuclease subunit M [Ardenticatenales bacterium]
MPTTEYSQPEPRPEERRRLPLFSLGEVVATPGALTACEEALADPRVYLRRHVTGDWGDLERDDKAANDEALTTGARILSAYSLPTDERLWIITEADRAYTTLLTPLEY